MGRSLVQSLVSAIVGGIIGAVLIGSGRSAEPEPVVVQNTGLQAQVSSLSDESIEHDERIALLEDLYDRVSYLENQDRLAVRNALAVNDAIQALTNQATLLTTRITTAPVGCYGEIAVWKPGLGLSC